MASLPIPPLWALWEEVRSEHQTLDLHVHTPIAIPCLAFQLVELLQIGAREAGISKPIPWPRNPPFKKVQSSR